MSENQGFSGGSASGGMGRGGASQDIMDVLRKPQSWIRVASLVFSIIVFAAISANGTDGVGQCAYNRKQSACDFGIAVGVIAFLAIIFFLVMDFAIMMINKEDLRKYFMLADFGFSTLWAFMWFVCFCFLTNEWRVADHLNHATATKNAAQGAIAFSFFSIVSWVALAVFGFWTFRSSGDGTGYSGFGSSGGGGGGGGASAPLAQDDPYQEAPGGDPEKPVY